MKRDEEKNAPATSRADAVENNSQEVSETNTQEDSRKTGSWGSATLISGDTLSTRAQPTGTRALDRLAPPQCHIGVPRTTPLPSRIEQGSKTINLPNPSSDKRIRETNEKHASNEKASLASSDGTCESSDESDDDLGDLDHFRQVTKVKLPEKYEKNKDWLEDLRQLDFANFNTVTYGPLGPPWACVVTFTNGESITAPRGATIHRVRVLAGGVLGTFHPFVTLRDENGEVLDGDARCGARHIDGLGFIKYELAPAPRSVTAINSEMNSRLSVFFGLSNSSGLNAHGENQTAVECWIARKRRAFHPQSIFAHPPNNCVVPRAQMAVMVDDIFRHPHGGRNLARIIKRSQFRRHALPRTYHCITRLVTASFPGNATNTQVIGALLDASIDPCYVPNPRSDPPLLFLAIQFNNILLIQRCLRAGADLTSVSRLYRCTPLALACLHNRLEAARLLLRENPSLASTMRQGTVDPPLCHAIRKGHTAMIDLLLEHRVDVNTSFRHKMSALLVATQKDDLELVRRLVRAKADLDARDVDGNFVLMLARTPTMLAYYLHEERRKPTQLHYTNFRGYTPFLFHLRKGQHDCATLLLRAKANAHATLPNGENVLTMTVRDRMSESTLALLQSPFNFDVNNVDSLHGWSVLMRAVRNGDSSVVELLLKRQANMGYCNAKGMSALKVAVRSHHDDMVELLRAHESARADWQGLLLSNYVLWAVFVLIVALIVLFVRFAFQLLECVVP